MPDANAKAVVRALVAAVRECRAWRAAMASGALERRFYFSEHARACSEKALEDVKAARAETDEAFADRAVMAIEKERADGRH